MTKVLAIIQARMGSQRLPGKVLLPIGEREMLGVLLDRLDGSRTLDRVMVATRDRSIDDPIERFMRDEGGAVFRGSENDCLDRYYQAARPHRPDVVVRLTGDNPLVDAEFVDDALEPFLAGDFAYMDTSLSDTYPVGLALEAIAFDALETAWREDADPATREHVALYVASRPQRFPQLRVAHETDLSHLRWTVDTAADLEFVRTLVAHFGGHRFGWRDAAAAVLRRPEWTRINHHVTQRKPPESA